MVDAARWERFLERGKREEARGRPGPAEAAYRRALRANPNFDSLQREFARFLENQGRPKEAEARVLRALKLGWPREEGEAALARLRGKAGVRRLIEAGRFEAAAKALRSGPAEPPEARGALWPEVFSALLCARRYRPAFALGEAMLRESARLPTAHSFLWPWWRGTSSRNSVRKTRFCARELARVRSAGKRAGFAVWFGYCRATLQLGLGRITEGLAEFERVKRLSAPRHAALLHPFVMQRLLAGEFEWTIAACRAILKDAPDYWWFRCRMAEAVMAGGDVAGGLREFELAAEGAADENVRRAVLTWHGAALLWAGRYRRSLAVLDEAAKLGTKIWVNCWRGGVRVKLGALPEALKDLDAAVEADPEDLEAHLWRGEAYRLLGRPADALRDLDRALALDAGYAWAYFNRALARGALGDEKGLAADFAMIPGDVVAALRGPKAGDPGPREMRAILERGLARAGGVRRPEHYLNSIWMRRPT